MRTFLEVLKINIYRFGHVQINKNNRKVNRWYISGRLLEKTMCEMLAKIE